ncbi:MAG: 50S ribosomal protein L17 [Planctomycetes bacterium]|nr:50S ribosomal protein L17 [Planctomycetota bacterium]
MRHMKRGRRLSRTSSHRKAMYRNLVAALFRHGRIITTPAKAKEARPFAEKLITLAKRGPDDLAARRRAIRLLHDPALVRSLFEDLGVRYKERPGGYTRILHLSKCRVGDGAAQVLFELVEGGAPAAKEQAAAPRAAVVADTANASGAASTGGIDDPELLPTVVDPDATAGAPEAAGTTEATGPDSGPVAEGEAAEKGSEPSEPAADPETK